MDIVGGFRKVIQDLLVPELKALQVELRQLREEVKKNTGEITLLRQEMNTRFEKLTQEMHERFEKAAVDTNNRFEKLTEEMNSRFEKVTADTNDRFEKLTEEMNSRFEKVTVDTNTRFEKLTEEMNKRFEVVTKDIAEIKMSQIKMAGTLEVFATRLELKDRLDKLERAVEIIKNKLSLDAA